MIGRVCRFIRLCVCEHVSGKYLLYRLRYNGPPIWNGIWWIQWSRTRQLHVKGHVRDHNMGLIISKTAGDRLGYNGAPIGNGTWGIRRSRDRLIRSHSHAWWHHDPVVWRRMGLYMKWHMVNPMVTYQTHSVPDHFGDHRVIRFGTCRVRDHHQYRFGTTSSVPPGRLRYQVTAPGTRSIISILIAIEQS